MSKPHSPAWSSWLEPSSGRSASSDPPRAAAVPAPPSSGEGRGDPPGRGDASRGRSERAAALLSRPSFYVEPQTIFCLATGESTRFGGLLEGVARTWGDPTVGFRTKLDLDWRGLRGLGLVRGRKYEFEASDPVTFETVAPYPTTCTVRAKPSVRTHPGGACQAGCAITLRVGPEASVAILAVEIRALERARSA